VATSIFLRGDEVIEFGWQGISVARVVQASREIPFRLPTDWRLPLLRYRKTT
jgi:hypothetical protein